MPGSTLFIRVYLTFFESKYDEFKSNHAYLRFLIYRLYYIQKEHKEQKQQIKSGKIGKNTENPAAFVEKAESAKPRNKTPD